MTNNSETVALERVSVDEAIRLHVGGKTAEAEIAYKQIIERGEKDDVVYQNLAVLCLNAGRHGEAIDLVNKALEFSKTNPALYLNLGVALKKQGDNQGAIAAYHNALALRPDYIDALGNLGLVWMDAGNLEEAENCFRIALAVEPNSATMHYYLGNTLRLVRKIDDAESSYRTAIDLNPGFEASYLNLGVLLFEKSLDEAIECFIKLLEINPDNAAGCNNLGNAYREKGEKEKAISLFNKALSLQPAYPEARHNLRLTMRTEGRSDDPIGHYLEILESSPDNQVACYELGVAFLRQNFLEESILWFQRALQLNSEDIYSYNDMGVALHMMGRSSESIPLYKKAIELNPSYVQAYLNMGVALDSYEDSIDCYRKALEIDPNYPEAHNNLGNALQYLGPDWVDEAISHFHRAVELKPDYSDAFFNLGIALHAQGKSNDAVVAYRRAIELRPNYPKAYLNLGLSISACMNESDDKTAESIACYEKALEFDPTYAEAYNNLGLALQNQGKLEESIECYRKAIAFKEGYPEPFDNLGNTLRELDELDESIDAHIHALKLRTTQMKDPESSQFTLELGMAIIELDRIPVVYIDESEIQVVRDHFKACLDKASHMVSTRGKGFSLEELNIIRGCIFGLTNFYLAYQQMNDIEFQRDYSKLVTEILNPDLAPYLSNQTPRGMALSNPSDRKAVLPKPEERGGPHVSFADNKIRLGIASELLKFHNGCFWAYDWFVNLPKGDYEFFAYSLNGSTDELTRRFASLGSFRWLPFRPADYQPSLKVIRDDALDILLIPDVGMTASSRVISLTRLAPIQCVGWGHPMTTGSDHIDFYLGSELMETSESDNHYSEQLVRLANIGLYFPDLLLPEENLGRAPFDLPEDKIIYGTVQSIFKYLPQFDFVYPAIAKQVPDSMFVFVGSNSTSLTSKFEDRIKRNFDKMGMDARDYIKILPRMNLTRFIHLLDALDVNLDSIGWSGGVTTLRSLAKALPVVTYPTEFMRGRHSYSMLKMVGIEELIAGTLDEYVATAVKLGLDKQYRSTMIDTIKQAFPKVLYDKACVDDLDHLFKAAVSKVRNN